MATRVDFRIFSFLFPHSLAVLQPYEKLLENIGFFCVCVCMHWLSGLNLLLALCSEYYSIQIYQIFSIASLLVLGVVITIFWSLCCDWLCLCWSRCHDPHTRFLQKCLYLAFKYFLAHFEKQDGHISHFSIFFLDFFLALLLWLCCNLSFQIFREINQYLISKCFFIVCVCANKLALLAKSSVFFCSKYYNNLQKIHMRVMATVLMEMQHNKQNHYIQPPMLMKLF